MEINDCDYRNHWRFTLRCIRKDLIPVNVRLKSTINNGRMKQTINRAERQLLQDRIKGINGILQDNAIKLDRCRSRLLSLVTTTTMKKCIDFINKLREFRFTKIRDRQVNKFNRLMGNKDRELTTQPLANKNQSQAQSTPKNGQLIFLTPPIHAQESFLLTGPNYAMAPTPLECMTSTESACQELDHKEAEELRTDINRVLRSSDAPKPNLTKEELKALVELRKDSNRIILTADKLLAMVVMDRKDCIEKATNLLTQPEYSTINRVQTNKLKAKQITLLRKIKRETGLEDNIYKYMYPMACTSSNFYWLPKIHKTNTLLRPIVSNRGSVTYGVAKVLARILKPLVGTSLHHVHSTLLTR